MHIGAINKGKGKNKSKGKKGNKGKATDNKATGIQDKAQKRAKRDKACSTKGPTTNYAQGKGKGQGKTTGKGKGYTKGCYRCGRPGHTAKDCRVAVYNIQEDTHEGHNDATDQWYGPQTTYDNHGGPTTKHKSMQCNHNNNN